MNTTNPVPLVLVVAEADGPRAAAVGAGEAPQIAANRVIRVVSQ